MYRSQLCTNIPVVENLTIEDRRMSGKLIFIFFNSLHCLNFLQLHEKMYCTDATQPPNYDKPIKYSVTFLERREEINKDIKRQIIGDFSDFYHIY